jgi:hypothetical protein
LWTTAVGPVGGPSVVGMAAGAVIVQATPALGTVEWLAEFLLSPGPAALAAVLAAVVGFGATRARIRAERAAGEAARQETERAAAVARQGHEDDRDLAQWWSTYRWAVERADEHGTDALDPVLEALGAAADDPVRSALVSVAWHREPDREGGP